MIALHKIAADIAALDHPDMTPDCLRTAADALRLAARRLDAQAEMMELEAVE